MASIYRLFRQKALSQNPTTAFENVFFIKKPQILGYKVLTLQQEIGKSLFLGREQRLILAVWGCTSVWPLLLAFLGLYLSQLRLSVSRALVAGTKPCLIVVCESLKDPIISQKCIGSAIICLPPSPERAFGNPQMRVVNFLSSGIKSQRLLRLQRCCF